MSRRSRRAKQKKTSSKGALKWLGWGCSLLLLVGIISVIFAYRAVRNYLQSEDFRVMLGTEAGALLGGDATFSSIRWNGWDVEVDDFAFTGEEGVQKIQAGNIEASVDIGAVWEGVYRVRNINLSHVQLEGDFSEREKEDESDLNGGADEPEAGKKAGFWAQFLPDEIELNGIRIEKVDGRVHTDDGDWTWENVVAKVAPGSGAGVYDIDLSGGDIRSPLDLVGGVTLKNAQARFSGNRIHLISSDLDALDRARITMEGMYSFDDKHWNFQGRMIGATVQEIIAEDWRQRLMGPIEIDYRVSGKPDSDARIQGGLSIDDGVLTALPVLDRIAAYANTARFRRLALSEASLSFSKDGSRMELSNIRLASEGLVRLEGSMRLEGDRITYGQFRLGIIPGTLAHLPGAETKVFHRGDLGLLWTPLVVSGTIDSPQEDLSERLIAAAGERMFELIPETGLWALKYGGEVVGDSTKVILANQGVILGAGSKILGGAGDLIKEGADALTPVGVDEVLKSGQDIVEDGVGTLFDLFGRPIPKEE